MKRLVLAVLLMAAGCPSITSSHRKADRKIYAAAAPFARAGGLSADTDMAWRILCGYDDVDLTVPGAIEDPELDNGMPRATTRTSR